MKFFRAPLCNRRCLLLLLGIFLLQEAALPAPKMRQAYTEDTNVTNVRFWNLLPFGSAPISVEVGGGGAELTPSLPSCKPGDYSGSSYWQFAPGPFHIVIRDPATKKVLSEAQIPMKAQQYLTVAAIPDPKTGKVALKAIDDTYHFSEDSPCDIAIFCSPADLKGTATVPGQPDSPLNPSGETDFKLPANAKGEMQIRLEVSPAKSINFTVPYEFIDNKRLSVVIAKDRYGRLRPQPFARGFIREHAEMVPVDDASAAQ